MEQQNDEHGSAQNGEKSGHEAAGHGEAVGEETCEEESQERGDEKADSFVQEHEERANYDEETEAPTHDGGSFAVHDEIADKPECDQDDPIDKN